VLQQVRLDQRHLQAGGERVEILDRARQRARPARHLAVGKVRPGDVADRPRAVRDPAGQRVRIAEEVAHPLDERGHFGVDIVEQLLRRHGVREERHRARLLQRDVGAEQRRVRRAHQPEHRAVGVDQADRHLRAAVERPADLRPRPAHHPVRFLEHRARLGGGERLGDRRAVGPGPRRVAVRAGAVAEHERVGEGELGGGRLAVAARRAAVRHAGGDRPGGVAADRDQQARRVEQPEVALQRTKAGRGHVAEAQQRAVDRDLVGGDRVGRREPLRARKRDRLLGVVVDVEHIVVERVVAVAHHPDAADDHAVLVQREPAGIGRRARAAIASARAAGPRRSGC
jgi:hypothetical protein